MQNNGITKYILFGIFDAVVIFLILIFLRPLLHEGETTAALMRDPTNWIFAVAGGAIGAWSLWRKKLGKK